MQSHADPEPLSPPSTCVDLVGLTRHLSRHPAKGRMAWNDHRTLREDRHHALRDADAGGDRCGAPVVLDGWQSRWRHGRGAIQILASTIAVRCAWRCDGDRVRISHRCSLCPALNGARCTCWISSRCDAVEPRAVHHAAGDPALPRPILSAGGTSLRAGEGIEIQGGRAIPGMSTSMAGAVSSAWLVGPWARRSRPAMCWGLTPRRRRMRSGSRRRAAAGCWPMSGR